MELKTFKRMADGKVVLEGVIYDGSLSKRAIIINPDTGNKIDSIQIGDEVLYPVGQVKKKK
jgi:outer membrane protein assembly factor BamB